MDIKELLMGAALGAGALTLAGETKNRVTAVAGGKSQNAVKDGLIGAACGVTTMVVGKESLSHLGNAFNDHISVSVEVIDTEMDPDIPVLDTDVEFDEVPEMEL